MSLLQPSLVSLERVPENIRGGVYFDYFSPGTVTFVLYAPFKPYVSLVGDFNNWNSRANRMVTDGMGLWWTTITTPVAQPESQNARPIRYGYYVAIDEQSHVWVGDPYAVQVDWSGPTPWALLPAPDDAFAWSDDQWRTPALRDLVIYELCVRDFAGYWAANTPHYGNFEGLTKYVSYLAELGVNAVELMPIMAFPGESSWGYNPVFYFAIANTYGGPADFKRFVDACHAHGIAVILDVALNHAWSEHPYYQIYPPLYDAKGNQLTDWNPFFHQTPSTVNMWGGVDWDHFTPETTRYFQDMVRFWLREYHVDGFRFDWAAGVDYDSRDPMQAGFNPYHGLSAICWAAHQAKADVLLIAEYWPLEGTNPTKTSASLVAQTPMGACWNGDFHHTLDDALNQRWQWEQRDLARAIGGFRESSFTHADQIVNYSCSHDEVRTEHEIKFYSWPHIQRPVGMSVNELALRKGLLGLITVFAAPGVAMIYAGQEFGEDSPRTIDFQPMHWAKLLMHTHAEHAKVVERLVQARRHHPALRSDHIEFYGDEYPVTHIVRFKRWLPQPGDGTVRDHAAVALNFDGLTHSVRLELPWPGEWYDAVQNQVHTAKNCVLEIVLAPWSGMLLTPNCS